MSGREDADVPDNDAEQLDSPARSDCQRVAAMGGPLSELVTGAVVAVDPDSDRITAHRRRHSGFLPVLGFWMVPLGMLLIAQDIPFLRRPTLRALLWLERKWVDWKKRRSK